ncbi:anaphase promoting complex subunit cdc16, variant 3 [Bonamia ostreae]|uniref:Anaphase promoting complex subunit cdc16, variant 3 n=1 Tax=Bonamia ostreae TaxID=126728 RepID=A0ABV2ANB2_9EUKA
MSAYRTANSIMPGAHDPNLYIAMEYISSKNIPRAKFFLDKISTETDPFVLNEWGNYYYKNENYEKAKIMFQKAISLIEHFGFKNWESVLFNLGNTLIKLSQYEAARKVFKRSLIYCKKQNKSSVLCALGICCHFLKDLEAAILYYNKVGKHY